MFDTSFVLNCNGRLRHGRTLLTQMTCCFWHGNIENTFPARHICLSWQNTIKLNTKWNINRSTSLCATDSKTAHGPGDCTMWLATALHISWWFCRPPCKSGRGDCSQLSTVWFSEMLIIAWVHSVSNITCQTSTYQTTGALFLISWLRSDPSFLVSVLYQVNNFVPRS